MARKRRKKERGYEKAGTLELRVRMGLVQKEIRKITRALRTPGTARPELGGPLDERSREALRRKRIALLLELETTKAEIAKRESVRGGKRVVQGPRCGVRSVVQGGAPGLGKRS